MFEVLFHKDYPRFFAFIKGFVKDESNAKDIAQNIFMKVWIHRETLNEELSISTYLYVLAKHEICNFFRAKKYLTLDLDLSSINHLYCSDVEENYNLKEMESIINDAIRLMPEKRRQIFRMSRLDHIPEKEIAEEMNISVRTVEKHIELALKNIRSSLETK